MMSKRQMTDGSDYNISYFHANFFLQDSLNHNLYGSANHQGSMDPQSMAPKSHCHHEKKWALGLQVRKPTQMY